MPSCIQPNKNRISQSIRVNWDLPVPPLQPTESTIDRFNLIRSPSLSLYADLKFNVPLNNVILISLSCSGGGFLPVDDTGVDTAKASNTRMDCLSHLHDANPSTRTQLKETSSRITDISDRLQMPVPSGDASVCRTCPPFPAPFLAIHLCLFLLKCVQLG
jgi:hypothetical protein